jgi:YhcH/YjgK/YiaL family protein
MIYGALETAYKYDLNDPKFKTAFAFLARKDLADLPVGWIDLDNGVRASVQEYVTQPASELDFETHEKFFDIHYMVKGVEVVGVCMRDGLKVKIPYSVENDVEFYYDPEHSSAAFLREGDYTVVGYEDAHKPHVAAGQPMAVKKIVIKLPV